eukprot:CAMPEP_0113893900 /NCGR_PEP_ID=MMETSP0780_2-20120614/16373_1 /TAXON_ID=652834 /ORGANISM="Palpitomonas bilix" /LENGTH=294 /DNA_ID=CAMNT_0000884289 /DNA_START=153 /DNA_END=1034 /DNA_ORIENTATION=- /assembly_acc=CAM_ASM_000599
MMDSAIRTVHTFRGGRRLQIAGIVVGAVVLFTSGIFLGSSTAGSSGAVVKDVVVDDSVKVLTRAEKRAARKAKLAPLSVPRYVAATGAVLGSDEECFPVPPPVVEVASEGGSNASPYSCDLRYWVDGKWDEYGRNFTPTAVSPLHYHEDRRARVELPEGTEFYRNFTMEEVQQCLRGRRLTLIGDISTVELYHGIRDIITGDNSDEEVEIDPSSDTRDYHFHHDCGGFSIDDDNLKLYTGSHSFWRDKTRFRYALQKEAERSDGVYCGVDEDDYNFASVLRGEDEEDDDRWGNG